MTASVLDFAGMDETELSELADAALTEVRTRATRKSALAWSQGEPDEPAPFVERRRTTVVLWTVVALAALTVGVLGGVWLTGTETHAVPTAAPATVLPSPPDVIVPTPPTPPAPVDPDTRFLKLMADDGWDMPDSNPKQLVWGAHAICQHLSVGNTETSILAQLQHGTPDATRENLLALIRNAEAVYCTQYAR